MSSVQGSRTLTQHWWECRRTGDGLPSYEQVVLGTLGRLADRAALVSTTGGRPLRLQWGGSDFFRWLREEPREFGVDELTDDIRQPIEELTTAALASAEPAYVRCDRVNDGVVTTIRLVGVPLDNSRGEPFVLIGLDGDELRTDLVQTMFSATDQGILALSTVRDATGAPVDFKIVALNEGAARLFGRPGTALQWQRLSEIMPGRSGIKVLQTLASIVGRAGREVFELSHPRSDGGTFHVKVEASCIGELLAVTMTDVGDIKAREESFRLLFDNNPLPMWLLDPATRRFVAVNDAAVSHYGYSRDEFLEKGPADLADADRAPQRAVGSDGPQHHRRADGSIIEVTLFERTMPFDGRPAVLGAVIDVTERRRTEARIAHMAHHDALTGLPNRVLFRECLAQTVADHARGGEGALLFCLDLDKFKIVNDTLGHPIGDELLRQAADRISDCLREGDIVARLGGDEFAVLIRNSVSPTLMRTLTERIIEAIAQPFHLNGQDCHIGTSIGIAALPRDGADPETLLRNADLALYRAKADGGGAYRCFEPEMDAWVQARRTRENDLREAFARGHLSLVYQPLMSAGAGRITAFEALLRWHHPELGTISPADFIPLAEETGLIGPIGTWVLRTACAEAARWPSPVRVAVNLSPVQFRNRGLVQTVKDALAEAGLDPSRLEIEITESVLLTDSKGNIEALHALRDLGVRIAMDDFGTGYSSLSYLRSFPFDKIKIDRSFVSQVGENAHCTAIVRAITGLGVSLGIATTAEGVETAAQLSMLRAEGCDEVQGFLLSRPISPLAARRLLADEAAQTPGAAVA